MSNSRAEVAWFSSRQQSNSLNQLQYFMPFGCLASLFEISWFELLKSFNYKIRIDTTN